MGNNDTKLSPVNILNRSYDPGLDVLMVEVIGADGVLKNVGEVNYDTTSVDMSNSSNIVVTYKLLGSTVATETISKSGSVINIVKS